MITEGNTHFVNNKKLSWKATVKGQWVYQKEHWNGDNPVFYSTEYASDAEALEFFNKLLPPLSAAELHRQSSE